MKSKAQEIASDAPQLSEAERAEIDAELAHLPYRASGAIDALQIVQRHRGWVSDEALEALAGYLGMGVAQLEGIATFYNLIFRKPVGENVIFLCDSVSCYLMGCGKLRARIRDKLGIDFGETTSDNRYTLLPITCLGACDRAPALLIGEELHGNVDEAKLDALLGTGGGA